MPNSLTRLLLVCFLLFLLVAKSTAQSNNKEPEKETLYHEIATMDSLLFRAFNSRDLESLKHFFTTDLELYQDNIGVRNYRQTVEAFGELFKKEYVLDRQLVKGSMEVYPIKDFGAIQSGLHQFCHTENGKQECAVFKFMHVWQNTKDGWKISRLITYDH